MSSRRRKSRDDTSPDSEGGGATSSKLQRLSDGSRVSSLPDEDISDTGASNGMTRASDIPSTRTAPDMHADDNEGADRRDRGYKGKGKARDRRNGETVSSNRINGNLDRNLDDGQQDEERNVDGHEGHREDDDTLSKARRMELLCRQHEEEDRQYQLRNDRSVGRADGDAEKENEGFSSTRSTSKGRVSATLTAEKGKIKDRDIRRRAEAGIVLRIYIHNFMCHHKLEVKLCRNVNFINGRNGSGKSAILAALQICLGAKANSTHRARKLSDFIRHGWKGDASLEVTLLNTADGFKFDEYGSSITVKRTIKRPTGGGFELIGHDGEVKSKSKDELNKMLDALNIQVDNPCAVLDQENSKKFLQGSERDKYAFFMKATDLDRVMAKISAYVLKDIEATRHEISKMKSGHHAAVEQLPRYLNIVAQLKEELEAYQGLEELERRINVLKEKIAWKYVAHVEDEVANAEEKCKRQGLKINSLKKMMKDFEDALGEVTARKDKLAALLEEGLAEATKLKEDFQRAHQELGNAQAPLVVLCDERQNMLAEQRSKLDKKRKAERALKDAKDRARRNASDEQEKRLLDHIHDIEETLSHNERLMGASSEEKAQQLQQAFKSAEAAAAASRRDFQQQQQESLSRQNFLRSLSTELFNPLNALGRHMPGLVNVMQQSARHFRNPPVGPIGAYVQLREDCKAYRVSIEGHLRGMLGSFIVTSQEDKTSLLGLIKNYRQRCAGNSGRWALPTIIIQPLNARYNVSQNPAGYLQIMQAINITNDQAFNALVDQAAIEKSCLFPSKFDAERACLRGRSGKYERMPHGMYEAYYPSLGGQSYSKFSITSDGNIQTRMNMVPRGRPSVLGVDEGTQRQEAEGQIHVAQAEVARTRRLADEAVRIEKAAKDAFYQVESARADLVRRGKELLRRKQKLETDLLKVKAIANESDPTEHLERCLRDATEEHDATTKELATLEGQVRELTAQIEPFQRNKIAKKKAHEEKTVSCKKLSDELEEETNNELNHKRKLSKATAMLTNAEEEEKELMAMQDATLAKHADVLQKTETLMRNMRAKQGLEWDGERAHCNTNTSLEKLREKANVASDRLKEEQKKRQLRGRSKAEVEGQLVQAVKVFKEKDTLVKRLEANMELIAEERKERVKKWVAMRKYVSLQTSILFNKYLQEKGASGEVKFDYDGNTLGLTYQKDAAVDSRQCHDVKLLSGGERSFATLALLLALGAGHECPFRVMDEFDVFMDAQSRNIAIKQVMAFAKNDSSRQFILITPQDLNSVIPSDTVKIHKMQPPRKGDHNQATLSFAR